MKEKDIEKFIDKLTDQNRESRERHEPKSELGELEQLWEDLGDLPQEKFENPRASREFREHLLAYEAGWEASKQGKPVGAPTFSSMKTAVISGLAACAAVALFAAGLLFERMSNDNEEALALELSQTREALVVSLISHSSAPQRVMGLNEVSKIQRPSATLTQHILEVIDSDANVNVRLAAIEAMQLLEDENLSDLLLARLESQDSPLVQMEIVRALLSNANESERERIIKELDSISLYPSIKDRVVNESIQI